MAVISGVEAFWLVKVSRFVIGDGGLCLGSLSDALHTFLRQRCLVCMAKTNSRGLYLHVQPAIGRVRSCIMELMYRHSRFSVLLVLIPMQQRAAAEVAGARRRGAPIGELRARFTGGRVVRRTYPAGFAATNHGASPNLSASQSAQNLSPLSNERGDTSDYEEGCRGSLVVMRGRRLSPVATCREHSRSAWLHFPHVELMFLFFAFQGAVASQVSVLRDSGCPEVFYTAVAALVRFCTTQKNFSRPCTHCSPSRETSVRSSLLAVSLSYPYAHVLGTSAQR